MIRVKSLRKTCDSCPSQWEGETDDGRYIYVRYRWGVLEAGVDSTSEGAVRNRRIVTHVGDGLDGLMGTREMMSLLSRGGPLDNWFDFSGAPP